MVRLASLLAVALIAGAVGCNRHKRARAEAPEPRPEDVVVSKIEPPPICTLQGTVTTTKDVDRAYMHLQEQAVELPANYVVLDGTRSRGWGYSVKSEMFGRAFWCPPQDETPPAYGQPAAPSATSSEAESSPTPPVVGASKEPPDAAGAPNVAGASPEPEAGGDAAPSRDPEDHCEPVCSPGYHCAAGACVPVCNPACKAPAVCGADRTCR